MWRAERIEDVLVPIYLLMGLVAVNFVLHGRFLTGKPMRREVVIGCSIVDVAVISLVIASASWGVDSGVKNPFLRLLLPRNSVLRARVSWRLAAVFTGTAIAAYLAICFVATPGLLLGASAEATVARVITMATAAVLGTMFWRVERDWRRDQVAVRRTA